LKHFLPKYLCFFFLLTLWLSVGKVLAQITSITVPGVSVPLTKSTETDSVTVGSTMPYYTMPDVNFNPAYSATSPMNNVESSFDWSATPPSSGCTISAVSSYTSVTNYKNINWSSTGAYTIGVTETSASTYGGCSGTTSFNVLVINAPTAQFSSAGLYQCLNTSSLTLPISITSAQKYIDSESAFIALTITAVNKADNSAVTLNAIANIYPTASGVMVNISSVAPYTSGLPEGIYTFTLFNVTDRISRKCGISGTIGSQNTITVYVKPPKPTLSTSAVK
jgi:hypothetical protein